jgi:hypothetical protein
LFGGRNGTFAGGVKGRSAKVSSASVGRTERIIRMQQPRLVGIFLDTLEAGFFSLSQTGLGTTLSAGRVHRGMSADRTPAGQPGRQTSLSCHRRRRLRTEPPKPAAESVSRARVEGSGTVTPMEVMSGEGADTVLSPISLAPLRTCVTQVRKRWPVGVAATESG